MKITGTIVTALTLSLAVVSPAFAQATRTWVSGGGSDYNSCDSSQPCATFAGALSKTASGGEIDVLDAGNFGPVTIKRPVTIDGGGQIASILINTAANAITIDTTGAGDTVILRNIQLHGMSKSLNGIVVTAGAHVQLENVKINGFSTYGVEINSSVPVDLFLRNVSISGVGQAGVVATSTSASKSAVTIDKSLIVNSNTGILASANSTISVRDSDVSFNKVGLHVSAGSAATIRNCQISNNTTGVTVSAGASLAVLSNLFTYNNIALGANQNDIFTDGANEFVGNTSNGLAIAGNVAEQ